MPRLNPADEARMGDLEARLDALQVDACAEARRVVRAILRDLEARFHRHRFYYLDGMGTMSVYMTPAFANRYQPTGESNLLWDLPREDRAIFDVLEEARDRITDFASHYGETFRIDLGHITTDNEEED